MLFPSIHSFSPPPTKVAPGSSTTGHPTIHSLSPAGTFFPITLEDVASVFSVRLAIYLWPRVVLDLTAHPTLFLIYPFCQRHAQPSFTS